MIETIEAMLMAKEETIESVGQYLFAEQDANVFAVLDGASVPGLLDKLYGLSPNFCCLFRGELQPGHGRGCALSGSA